MKIGILGAGQLSRMLVEAAETLSLSPYILTQSKDEPATQVTTNTVMGTLQERESLRALFQKASFIAFENEFVSCPLLEQASKGFAVQFLPSLEVIAKAQDKLEQKKIFKKLKIPTAEFKIFEPQSEPSFSDWVHHLPKDFSILKWSKFGYDGKGNFFVKPDSSKTDLESFHQAGVKKGSRTFVEKHVDFVRELAMVCSFSTQGEFKAYPLVISEQEQGTCHWVTGPAIQLGVAADLERLARQYAETLARDLLLYGTFALEFFETRDGRLLVNELAPRVHNSGHYTLLGDPLSPNAQSPFTNQFENHWRAILGMPLGSTELKNYFVMLNLLGPRELGNEKKPATATLPPLPDDFFLYWYDKKEVQSGRKMGHINAVAGSPEHLRILVDRLKNFETLWKMRILK